MISFIVPVKNGLRYTRALVESVRRGNPGAAVEWVIVDSGSTDGTPEYAAEIGARLVPFRREPFNYCAAIDAGAAAASGSLWIVANNDIEFRSTGDLARLERLFREWPIVAAASPGRPAGAAEFEFAEGGINGACWAVRPEAFRAWGGLPERLSGYGYDEAFTHAQIWRHGYAFALLTGWNVFHYGSATFAATGGNTTPALRRNLSRLLAILDAADLDREGSPERILERLYQRERERAPARLGLTDLPGGMEWLRRQGYVGARPVEAERMDIPRVVGDVRTAESRQWLPWLANELLLQPEAPVVGADGWYAVRAVHDYLSATREVQEALLREARAVGPPPPPCMAPLPPKRPGFRHRLLAAVHTWRSRRIRLPEGW